MLERVRVSADNLSFYLATRNLFLVKSWLKRNNKKFTMSNYISDTAKLGKNINFTKNIIIGDNIPAGNIR